MHKKPLAPVLLGLTLILSGCSAAAPAAPEATATSAAEQYGDVICFETVEDVHGKYCHITIAPDADVLTYDAAKTDLESMDKFGFTEEDAREALPVAVTLFVEEILDSERLDNYDTDEATFFRENSAFYSDTWRPKFLESIDAGDGNVLRDNGIVLTGLLPEPTVRDGEPRANGGTNITLDSVYAVHPDGGEPNLVFRIKSTSTYTLADEQIVDAVAAMYPQMTEAALSTSDPDLYEDGENSSLIVQGTTVLGFGADSNEKLIGNNTQFTLETSNGTQLSGDFE
jgi:predicted RNase H-like HicB family nuclease